MALSYGPLLYTLSSPLRLLYSADKTQNLANLPGFGKPCAAGWPSPPRAPEL